MLRIYCDRCDINIKKPELNTAKFQSQDLDLVTTKHLCKSCYKRILDFINKLDDLSASEDDGNVVLLSRDALLAKYNTIDFGKVIALHKAGWSSNKISGELYSLSEKSIKEITLYYDSTGDELSGEDIKEDVRSAVAKVSEASVSEMDNSMIAKFVEENNFKRPNNVVYDVLVRCTSGKYSVKEIAEFYNIKLCTITSWYEKYKDFVDSQEV